MKIEHCFGGIAREIDFYRTKGHGKPKVIKSMFFLIGK